MDTPASTQTRTVKRASDYVGKQVMALAESFDLTQRESDVANLLAHGHTVPDIAEMLVLSPNTVKTHTKRLYAKLDIHKKAELIELIIKF